MSDNIGAVHGTVQVFANTKQAEQNLDRFQKFLESSMSKMNKDVVSLEKSFERLGSSLQGSATKIANSFSQVNAQLKQTTAQIQAMYASFRNIGRTPSEALFNTFNQRASQQNAAYRVQNAINNAPPPVFGGGGGRRRGGGLGGFLGGAGRILGPLGLGYGATATAMQAGRAIIESTELATAYDRQEIAALRLAGSQEQLNKLLDAYAKATGNAVDKATSLSDVTRLQATGFADSAEELDRFIRGARGASIALGKPQDYINQEVQLAVSNTSFKRLDQIGLGIEEVNERIDELRSANSDWTQEMAFSEAVIGLLNEKYGGLSDTLEGQATQLEKLGVAWKDFFLELGQDSQSSVNRVAGNLNKLLNAATQFERDRQEKERRNIIRNWALEDRFPTGQEIFRWGGGPPLTPAQLRAQSVLDLGYNPYTVNTRGVGQRGDAAEYGYRNTTNYGNVPTGYTQDQRLGMLEMQNQVAAFERGVANATLQEVESFERQREQIIIQYGKSIVREEEDFQRSRARSQRDYERAVGDVGRQAAKRDAEMREDFEEQRAEREEDYNERIAEIQEDYQKDRERAEEEHYDRQLKAAGALDAVALLEERKRWRRENKEREDAHKERLGEEKEQLDEGTEDAEEALRERLEDAREADEERLEEMRRNREQQLADEDEDRALRLERQAEDHQAQLDELDNQHALRLEQIQRQAASERQAMEDEHLLRMAELKIEVEGYADLHEKQLDDAEKWFQEYLKRIEKNLKEDADERAKKEYNPDSAVGPRLSRQHGGWLPKTGTYYGHAGEYVLSADMLAGRAPVPGTVSKAINNSSSKNIVVQDGAIRIETTPGMEMMVGGLVEEHLVRILEAA